MTRQHTLVDRVDPTQMLDTPQLNIPTVSLVLVTMNSAKFVGRSLASIRAQTYPADRLRTVVVDHASRDGTPGLICRDFPWVTLVIEKVNHGFAGGNNLGMRRYPADYYAFVNPDATIAPDWVHVLVQSLDSDPTIGVAGSKIFYADGKLLQHAGAMFRPNALTYHLGDHEPDNGQYNLLRDVDYVMGAAFMVRGALARQVGYMPEEYFPAYFEEADLCTQIRKAGKRVVYVPEAVAWHDEKHSGSGSYTRRYLRRYHKHRYLYALRNLTTSEERQKFTEFEREWRNQYATDLQSRLLLLYSKLINWRWLIRRPWLWSV